MTLRLIRLGLDAEPIVYADGMLLVDQLVEALPHGGDSTVLLAQTQATLATGERSPLGEQPAHPMLQTHQQGRAGGTTYFGPGVLLIAPVVRADALLVHEALLTAADATCARYGVTAVRRDRHPGLWVHDDAGWRKIASIGLSHNGLYVGGGGGLSLNVCPDPAAYDGWDPCGIDGIQMTSLAAETGRTDLTVYRVVLDGLADDVRSAVEPVLIAPEAMAFMTAVAAAVGQTAGS